MQRDQSRVVFRHFYKQRANLVGLKRADNIRVRVDQHACASRMITPVESVPVRKVSTVDVLAFAPESWNRRTERTAMRESRGLLPAVLLYPGLPGVYMVCPF